MPFAVFSNIFFEKHSGQTVLRAMPVLLAALAVLALAYRYYSAFLAAKVAALDDESVTPAFHFRDKHNYEPTNRWILFGHHFAAIAGAGPLIGPVLAAQFGYAPGLIWLVGGVCLAGAVHDSMTLWASTRRGGASLADIARSEIGPVAGATASRCRSSDKRHANGKAPRNSGGFYVFLTPHTSQQP